MSTIGNECRLKSGTTFSSDKEQADGEFLYAKVADMNLPGNEVYITTSSTYGVYRNDDDSLTDTVTISQNEAGIDTEDRIIKLKKYIANMK